MLYKLPSRKDYTRFYFMGMLHMVFWSILAVGAYKELERTAEMTPEEEAETTDKPVFNVKVESPVARQLIAGAIGSVGVLFLVAGHIHCGRHVLSIKVVNQGKNLAIENCKVFGRKVVVAPAENVQTLKRAFTGVGPNGAEVDVPQSMPWYQALWTAVRRQDVPLVVKGKRSPYKVVRTGDFIPTAQAFDALLYSETKKW
ncbi:hypothetical protein HK104_003237 [Borealophlyctis nickersoniae]|nr:hypothetical protein HK104_003237 [Borealophlyctis nickersoniae]